MLNKYLNSKLLKSLVIYLLSILMALVLYEVNLREENILLIFVIGILITIVETGSLFYGILYSVVYVFTFNFFFTEPKFTFNVNDPNYFVSFGIFFLVAMIVTTLTVRLQKQMSIAKQNAKISEKLYEISKGFLHLTNETTIIAYCEKELSELLTRDVRLFMISKKADREGMKSEILWCYDNSFPCGFEETKFSSSKYKFSPVRSGKNTIGVVQIDCSDIPFNEDDNKQLSTILFQLTIATERLRLNVTEEENRIKIERENLRSNLLRSISHDLRTPLTGIAGGSEFLLENIKNISTDEAKIVLSDISSEAYWLGGLVENLLNMTRIQDGQLTVTKKIEVVDDIIDEGVSKMNKRKGKHTVNIIKPIDITVAPMDAQLIIQVLINLLDNAFRHTQENSIIDVSYRIEKNMLLIDVCDNGYGIASNRLSLIFDDFYTNSSKAADGYRGIGLGLSICKSIVTAHGGELTAKNNESGGACFMVKLPIGE
ncbi:MAG: ATP-binding protein [Eubacteriaceae bacterium]